MQINEDKKEVLKDFGRKFVAGGVSGAAVQLAIHKLDTDIVQGQTGKKVKLTLPQHLKTIGKKIGKGTLASAIGFPIYHIVEERMRKKYASLHEYENEIVPQKLITYYLGGAEEQKTYHLPTTEAIKKRTQASFSSKPPFNIGKETRTPLQKLAAIAGILGMAKTTGHFLKGMSGFGKATEGFKKSFYGGMATATGGAFLAPTMKATNLETATKNIGKIRSYGTGNYSSQGL